MTRASVVNADIVALLKARHTLLWITTREERRVENALAEACAAAKYPIRFWDCYEGITDTDGAVLSSEQDPTQALGVVQSRQERCVYVFRDLHKWMDPIVLRTVRSLARKLQNAAPDNARSIIILTTSSEIPPELAGHATVIDYPLPDREEIATLLDDVVSSLPDEIKSNAAGNGTRDAAIDAAVGLTAEEAGNCYARSLVTTRTIDPAQVAQEKKRVIARERVLTWHDPDPRGLDAIGGLDVLKDWLRARKAAFSVRAREFGLPAPRGVMLYGISGCGKSLTAKCIASAWQYPLLRLDMGAIKSKYVGESESNIRKALQVAEAVSPCVLWLDEVEKALGGATGPQGDGGVSADALGAVLSWMQERSGQVFVVATANDVSALPPELLRKGRFDELFFVDLPTLAEREAIIRATLAQYDREADAHASAVASATGGFTGAEIAALVPDALFTAFADDERPLNTSDLLEAAATVVPLSKTASEKIDALRKWAKGRARNASAQPTDTGTKIRTLDLSN